MKVAPAVDDSLQSSVRDSHAKLLQWLLEAAYPTWSTLGVDAVRGGFRERLTLEGKPTDDARRARVQPRQVYAFSMAPALGWKGDAAGAAVLGLEYFLKHFRRPDGLFRSLIDINGAIIDDKALLYDQAFALLGFATALPVPGVAEVFDVAGEGESLRQAILTHLKRSAGPGFESGLPHGPPLLSNPHMHMLESSLVWADLTGGGLWNAWADEIGELALSLLIDPATGMLHETFDNSWTVTRDMGGRLIEPGHQFEWAWLLLRWGERRVDARQAALRLIDNAETYGVRDGAAVNVLVGGTSVHDGSARLWPQTERLRVGALAARLYGDNRYWKMAAEACATLLRYLDTSVPGLWYDRMSPSGELVPETVTAGNLYHIVGAIYEMGTLIRSIS